MRLFIALFVSAMILAQSSYARELECKVFVSAHPDMAPIIEGRVSLNKALQFPSEIAVGGATKEITIHGDPGQLVLGLSAQFFEANKNDEFPLVEVKTAFYKKIQNSYEGAFSHIWGHASGAPAKLPNGNSGIWIEGVGAVITCYVLP